MRVRVCICDVYTCMYVCLLCMYVHLCVVYVCTFDPYSIWRGNVLLYIHVCIWVGSWVGRKVCMLIHSSHYLVGICGHNMET
jgi:hypothetical protein